jgi:hypothetical protein
MTLSTKNISNRRSAVEELKQKHIKLFEQEGVDKAKFIPKMAYIPKKGAERIIALFPSEIMGGEDIYTEFVSKQNVPEDPERTLWKWQFNPEFETEYEKSEPHPATGHCRYLIPVEELINVALQYAPVVGDVGVKQTELPLEVVESKDDAPLSEMTMRDEVAIRWELPVSNKEWLNELIREKNKESGPFIPG